ncbi:hypothetical protein [Photobacterium damselae]|uniref:hypothetical protein n=1 Tax=Photobacterium damselae TaxID=38293 RepID=UPI001F35C59F|nr:hypothetical protein [Photobacterium damselae]UKA12697.1 hypothetical protein IHC91_17475 [Photobacterium damselae subsp. damselae]
MTEKELFKQIYRFKRLSRKPRCDFLLVSELHKLTIQYEFVSSHVLKRLFFCAAVSLLVRDCTDTLVEKSQWRRLVHFDNGLPF